MKYNNKLVIGLLLGFVFTQSGGVANAIQLRTVSRLNDDEDGVEKKVDEVDALMNKYDDDEKHEAYLKSPEFKKDQEKKKKEAESKQMDETS